MKKCEVISVNNKTDTEKATYEPGGNPKPVKPSVDSVKQRPSVYWFGKFAYETQENFLPLVINPPHASLVTYTPRCLSLTY